MAVAGRVTERVPLKDEEWTMGAGLMRETRGARSDAGRGSDLGRRSRSPLVAVFVAAALVVTPACGTATISCRDGSKVEGTIVGSSGNFIKVEQESGGRAKSIARDDIADIDHPGNVLALAGSLVLAFGVVTLAAWGSGDCENRALGGCAGLYTPPAVGAGLMIWGSVVWMRSSMAAGGSTTGSSRPVHARLWPGRSLHLLPLVARQDGDRRLLGGALALSF